MILPASFTGGKRYLVTNYRDAMDNCRVYGPPDIFVTFTCNTEWGEIADALSFEPGQQPCDRSDVVERVFHMKVDEFMADISEVLHTIEFWSRGLPHIQCFVWLDTSDSESSASAVGGFVCIENAIHEDSMLDLSSVTATPDPTDVSTTHRMSPAPKIIMLSASANKLLRLKEQAEGYAALIMEELDPERAWLH